MRPPFYYPPSYMPANYMPTPRFQPFAMRPPMPMPPMAGPAPGIGPVPGPLPTAQSQLPGFLANAQSIFEQAQKYTPYFQQAAPMMKNLPALWRMYKGFKQDSPAESSSAPAPRRKRSKPVASPTVPRPSVPKIYQPPYDF